MEPGAKPAYANAWRPGRRGAPPAIDAQVQAARRANGANNANNAGVPISPKAAGQGCGPRTVRSMSLRPMTGKEEPPSPVVERARHRTQVRARAPVLSYHARYAGQLSGTSIRPEQRPAKVSKLRGGFEQAHAVNQYNRDMARFHNWSREKRHPSRQVTRQTSAQDFAEVNKALTPRMPPRAASADRLIAWDASPKGNTITLPVGRRPSVHIGGEVAGKFAQPPGPPSDDQRLGRSSAAPTRTGHGASLTALQRNADFDLGRYEFSPRGRRCAPKPAAGEPTERQWLQRRGRAEQQGQPQASKYAVDAIRFETR